MPPEQVVAELERLAALLPCPVPDDARELLGYARGFEGGPLASIDFSGTGEPIFEEIFLCGLPIAHDGSGKAAGRHGKGQAAGPDSDARGLHV